MKKVFVLGVMSVLMLIIVSGCQMDVGGNEESFEVQVDKDHAKELEVELNIGAGELNVESGGKEWVEGTIDYNHKKLEPEISYKVKGDAGVAVIEQGEKGLLDKINIGEIENHWNLRLNDEIPMDLVINSGASETMLDLKGLELQNLEVNAGVGDISIDLSGDWQESFDASLDMGIGKSTIILPSDVGVKIEASKGIGESNLVGFVSQGNGVYVNDAFKDADVVINLKTNLGVGEATFKME
ncbi:toast rack family protein [Mesobacillus maritimus]|nr:toast rack family protein [Mesobacillus maritimus]